MGEHNIYHVIDRPDWKRDPPPPPPPPGIATNCYGYAVGGVPLAFTQEDFLVLREVTRTLFFGMSLRIWCRNEEISFFATASSSIDRNVSGAE